MEHIQWVVDEPRKQAESKPQATKPAAKSTEKK